MYTILMYIHPANVNRFEMELDAYNDFTIRSAGQYTSQIFHPSY
jgi:hypothetical protein